MRDPAAQPAARNIFINGRLFTQRITGVQRYGRETLAWMDRLIGEGLGGTAQWSLLLPTGAPAPALAHIAVQHVGRLGGHAWEQIELPWHARGGLLLNFGFTGPLVKARQVITIHDAAVVRMPQAYGWKFRAWYRLVIGIVSARAPRVLTVSQFSADEAVACFGIAPERLRVMAEGWQHLDRIEPDDSILDRHGLRGQPFALAVSSPTPNKNFGAIAQALALLGPDAPRCVAVGAADAAVFQAADGGDALMRVGYVSDGELKALYQHATCFVFPSFYEGFGIPALEAMACGCPVLATTAPAVVETCGEAARYFDPARPAELATRLGEMFASPAQQAQMRAQGLARAQLFSWRRSAELNLAALAEGGALES